MRSIRLKIRFKRPALGSSTPDPARGRDAPTRPPARVSPAILQPSPEPEHEPEVEEADPPTPAARSAVATQPALPHLDVPPESGDPATGGPPPAERAPARSGSVPLVPRRAAGPAGPACPNCEAPLGEKPRAKTTCPHCARTVHVRGWQRLFPWGLVPESEVDAVDFLEGLEPLGIDQDRCLERLGAPGRRPPEPGALGKTLWSLCEERLPRMAPAQQVRLLNEMARYRQWRGEDARPLLRRAQVVRLQQMRASGVERVRLACRGAETCAACKEQAGRTMTLETALQEQPLPHADCLHGGGLCRCHYAGVD